MAYLDDLNWEERPQLSEADNSFLRARSAMFTAVQDFGWSLDLFHIDETVYAGHEEYRSFRWRLIACKDGALNIYHFGKSLSALKSQCSSLPVSSEYLRTVNAAVKMFQKRFPHSAQVRNFVAHAAEVIVCSREFNEHKLREKVVSDENILEIPAGTISQSLEGSRFSVTRKGKLMSFVMEEATLEFLRDICMLVAPVTSKKFFAKSTLL